MSYQQFEARDIWRILEVDRNTLFYWVKGHNLIVPEIAEAAGTGSRVRYSMKNLVELATVKALAELGVELARIGDIMGVLANPHPKLDSKSSVDYALIHSPEEAITIRLFLNPKGGLHAQVERTKHPGKDEPQGAPHAIKSNLRVFSLDKDHSSVEGGYAAIEVDLGLIASSVLAKAKEK